MHSILPKSLQYKLWNLQVEYILFAAGEALSFIWGAVPVSADRILKSNYSSFSQSSNYFAAEMPFSIKKSNSSESCNSDEESHVMIREVITQKLFEDLLYSSRKEERCAGTVWLLSLLMYCGHHQKIQQLLPEIQVCNFVGLALRFSRALCCYSQSFASVDI